MCKCELRGQFLGVGSFLSPHGPSNRCQLLEGIFTLSYHTSSILFCQFFFFLNQLLFRWVHTNKILILECPSFNAQVSQRDQAWSNI